MNASEFLSTKISTNCIIFKKNTVAAIGLRVRFYIYSSNVHDSINNRADFIDFAKNMINRNN